MLDIETMQTLKTTRSFVAGATRRVRGRKCQGPHCVTKVIARPERPALAVLPTLWT